MSEQGAPAQKVTCSTHTRMVLEDEVAEEEADWAKEEANKVCLMRVTPTFGKKAATPMERSEGGGASMSGQADKTTACNAAIARQVQPP